MKAKHPVPVAVAWLVAVCLAPIAFAVEPPKPFVTGLKTPWAVCYGPKDRLYVTDVGEVAEAGGPEPMDHDGRVMVIENGEPRVFAEGLDDPMGMVYYRDALYVADKTKIVKVDAAGQTSDYLTAKDFPSPPHMLIDIAVDREHGVFLVSDGGERLHGGSALYRIDSGLKKIDAVASKQLSPELRFPLGIAFDGESHALVAHAEADALFRVKFADHSVHRLAEAVPGACGLIWDHHGRLFITSYHTGAMFAIPRPGEKPVGLTCGLQSSAFGCLDSSGKNLIIPDDNAGTLTMFPTTIPGWEVDESPLPVETAIAFPNLQWTGWDNGAESGKVDALRPIVLTHAGDGSNRVFVATQQGVIHAFDNSDAATKTDIFLDISDRVRYIDKQNEEGLLGLAFHPKFASNGELFVFYTDVKEKSTNVVSRFRLKPGSRTEADPASEEQLLRIEKPYWNHDGGTIVFGPDGYLYIAHGDGGLGGDPHENGQNLATMLGKVLRIDVDHKSPGKNYAVPADNPFINRPGAAPEVWAYGLRNVWRMAFDRKTGQLWAGDVGQNRFEEIDLIEAGGNYGWNVRESLHPFGAKGVDTRPDLIEPIWEYDHDIGKSITGGLVYRGGQIPELGGAYLYADYVTTRLWALRYDPDRKRVVANHPIKSPGVAVMSFGEDELGEAYLLSASPTGRGIFRFVQTGK